MKFVMKIKHHTSFGIVSTRLHRLTSPQNSAFYMEKFRCVPKNMWVYVHSVSQQPNADRFILHSKLYQTFSDFRFLQKNILLESLSIRFHPIWKRRNTVAACLVPPCGGSYRPIAAMGWPETETWAGPAPSISLASAALLLESNSRCVIEYSHIWTHESR